MTNPQSPGANRGLRMNPYNGMVGVHPIANGAHAGYDDFNFKVFA
jgi:hypothetical protein